MDHDHVAARLHQLAARLDAGANDVRRLHRLARRVQTLAVALVALGLLVLALVAWQTRAVWWNSQTIAAQTRALLEGR